MDDIKWVDAPPATTGVRNSGVAMRFVAELKKHPGTWAQYQPERAHSGSGANNFNRGFPGVEAVLRRRPDGKYDVYARWVGNGDGHG